MGELQHALEWGSAIPLGMACPSPLWYSWYSCSEAASFLLSFSTGVGCSSFHLVADGTHAPPPTTTTHTHPPTHALSFILRIIAPAAPFSLFVLVDGVITA